MDLCTYLFVSEKIGETGSYVLQQDANQKYVNYTFSLTTTNEEGSNNYFDVYKFTCDEGTHVSCKDPVMNPEDSWFTSNSYERHFAENW